MLKNTVGRAAAILMAAGAATTADATWSIILIDTRTGEVALGSATCLTNFDLQAGTPVLLTGIGGATAQSFVDNTGQNRTFIRDRLIDGTDPDLIIELLADFDPGHQTRQYGIGDVMGGTTTFSGTGAGAWKGGVTGQVGDIVYAIQGNVLTGEPVVLMAEQAVLLTEGDLAAKMMAGMEAARLMGGDGRCSCTPNNPEGCGAPPPNFDKSAHIAYMLIARTGDVDLCNASYKGGTQPWSIDSGDLDGDGLIDVIVGDRVGDQVSVLTNQSVPDVSAMVLSDPTFYPAGGEVYDVAIGDLDDNGTLDVVFAIRDANEIGIRLGNGDATFGEQTSIALPDEPERVELIDLNMDGSPDVAAVVPDASAVYIAVNNGDGTFAAPLEIAGAGNPTDLAVSDVDDDGDVDVLITDTSLDSVLIFENDAGSFALSSFEFVGANPADIIGVDLDDDGDEDFIVSNNSDATVSVLLKGDGVSFEQTMYETWNGPARAQATDLDGDGHLDIVAMSNPNRFTIMRGIGGGSFEVETQYPTIGNNGDMVMADMDDDGDLDFVSATRVPGTVYLVPNLGGGVFNDQLGCGSGDHFMQFNIAFQSPNDPDPVFQLQDLFDTWRDDLVARPDAVQSIAEFDPASIPGDSTSMTTLTVTPLDWQGMPAIDAVQDVHVAHAPGSDALGTIGSVTIGDESITIEVTAGIKPGVDSLRVTLDDGVRPVTLMPDPSIEYSINIDFNGDGELTILDFVHFQLAFQAGDEAADVNADGELSILDFVAFTEAFQMG